MIDSLGVECVNGVLSCGVSLDGPEQHYFLSSCLVLCHVACVVCCFRGSAVNCITSVDDIKSSVTINICLPL